MINYKRQVVQDDLKTLYNESIDWSALKNKSILITGATGMLASYFSFMIQYLNEQDFGIKLFLLARNKNKLEQFFGIESDDIIFIIQDICEKIEILEDVDYIFHAAGAASPYYIINDPVGIIKANTLGTINVLEFARKAKTKKVIFTSTREVYGKVENQEYISESDMGVTDPLEARSCYPESKRMAETILKSYSIQYRIPFNTIRIAHTYGPGMQLSNDGRVMADFLNDAINRRDININSEGKAVRAFCYITDAIEAIFRILINGKHDEAYNVANETEPIRLIDLAKMIQRITSNNKNVKTLMDIKKIEGYCAYKPAELDTRKIDKLGWKPKVSLEEGIEKTLKFYNR